MAAANGSCSVHHHANSTNGHHDKANLLDAQVKLKLPHLLHQLVQAVPVPELQRRLLGCKAYICSAGVYSLVPLRTKCADKPSAALPGRHAQQQLTVHTACTITQNKHAAHRLDMQFKLALPHLLHQFVQAVPVTELQRAPSCKQH
jgi:hypothetical protein